MGVVLSHSDFSRTRDDWVGSVSSASMESLMGQVRMTALSFAGFHQNHLREGRGVTQW